MGYECSLFPSMLLQISTYHVQANVLPQRFPVKQYYMKFSFGFNLVLTFFSELGYFMEPNPHSIPLFSEVSIGKPHLCATCPPPPPPMLSFCIMETVA